MIHETFRFSRCVCEKVSEHAYVIIVNWLENFGHCCIVSMPRPCLIVVVVGVDVLFLRNRFWARLIVNVGIVLVFWAFYLTFLKQ